MHFLTVIGSTDTPEAYCHALRQFTAQAIREHGVQVRSGGARGADTAAEDGAHLYLTRDAQLIPHGATYVERLRQHLRVYLPYDGHRGKRASPFSPYIDAQKLLAWEEAQTLILTIHPNPNALLHAKNPFALQAHTRNAFQVLGDTLKEPSDLLLCWAPTDKQGDAIGGTRTAWMLAGKHNVPRFNLSIHTPDAAYRALCDTIRRSLHQ